MPNLENAVRDPALETALRRAWGLTPIYAFQRVGSTMEIAHALAGQGASEGTLVWAASQAQGRGRLGRTWASLRGGAYFSLILRPARPKEETPQLALLAGLAAAEAVQALTGLLPSIRWPNDLLLDGRKVAGILVETTGSSIPAPPVVIGIGINVTTDAKDLPDTATSLSASGAACDPLRLTGELCRRFLAWYDVWAVQGFGPVREALRPWTGLLGQVVRVAVGSGVCEGTAAGLDADGRLLVRLDSGVARAFDAGEVTLLRGTT